MWVLCNLKSGSQTFEFYRFMKRNIEATKTFGGHDKWVAIKNFFVFVKEGYLKLPFICHHHFKREIILTP